MMLNGEEERGTVVWYAKAVVLLQLSSGRRGEEREALFLRHSEVTTCLDAVEKTIGCNCVNWSTYDKRTIMLVVRSLIIVF